MPCSQEWINNPLGVVEAMFGENQNNPDSKWEAKAVGFFQEALKEKDAQTTIPSLNDVPLHYLKPNSLVKFRCLIQDMFDPEFYMGVYETADPSTKNKVLKCGKYRDVAESGIDFNSEKTVTAERQTFYCVPIPGENRWVKDISFHCVHMIQTRVMPSTSYTPIRQKRSYEEDDGDAMDTQQTEPQAHSEHYGNGDCKRQETEAPSHQPPTTTPLDLNFPLPGEKGPSCLVKVYEDWDKFKVNDMLEVYGVLSVSPALSALADEKESCALLDPSDTMETAEEQRARPLCHNNPLLPPGTLEDNSACKTSLSVCSAELLSYFSHFLLGDALAAEYLILHLISTVYARRDVLPLGKFTLNLSGCPPGLSYSDRLYQLIQQLVPSSHYLPMSLQNMNQMRLVPKKDYTANRLLSGALQLSSNTSLFLDETRLEQGQLDTTGVRNVTALGNLISWQKVDYDFNYHQMEFPCNINVLVSSEGRSLLPSDCQVPLQSQIAPAQMEEHLSSLPHTSSAQINRFRTYLSVARLLDYNISDQMTKSVEDDFDLHRLLVVARLLSLSAGETALSRDSWFKAKHLETLRRSRMEQHCSVNGNEP
uniref:Mini-chromosome maintenance complex-binding protein n=1 Tax=Neogobius melanostomus TaxID=47308 RepID=A0A8C6SD45_9GOBI